jgi:hypothetical protein
MIKKLFFSLFLLLLTGCIRSLHPIYTDETVIFKPELVGKWFGEEDDEYWFFSPVGDNHYGVIFCDDGKIQGPFDGYLCRIDDVYFLDLYPAEETRKDDSYFQFHFLPVHTFLYVQQFEPTLIMRSPSSDWLEKYLEVDPGAIKHEIINDEIVLTASPVELQQFWSKHVDTDSAFTQPDEFIKRAN